MIGSTRITKRAHSSGNSWTGQPCPPHEKPDAVNYHIPNGGLASALVISFPTLLIYSNPCE